MGYSVPKYGLDQTVAHAVFAHIVGMSELAAHAVNWDEAALHNGLRL